MEAMKSSLVLLSWLGWMGASFAGVLVGQAEASDESTAVVTSLTGFACLLFGFFIKQIWPALKRLIKEAKTEEESAIEIRRLRAQLDAIESAQHDEWVKAVKENQQKLHDHDTRLSKLEK